MRTTTHRIIAAGAAGVLSLLLVGCGGDDDKDAKKSEESSKSSAAPAETPAEDAVEAPTEGSPIDQVVSSSQTQLKTMKESMKSMYSDIEILADGDSTLVYRYTYAEALDPKAIKEALDKGSETLKSTTESTIIPSLETAGITAPQVKYVYLDPKGALIWEKTYSK